MSGENAGRSVENVIRFDNAGVGDALHQLMNMALLLTIHRWSNVVLIEILAYEKTRDE